MAFLLRVLLPDTPGSLGRLAEAIGGIGADIRSVDVVQTFTDGTVMDDMVVSIPKGVMVDSLLTAAQTVDGVLVDSVRPFSGTVDRRGQIEMLAKVAGTSSNSDAIAKLIDTIPYTLTSTWAILLRTDVPVQRVTASDAAPEDDGSHPAALNIDSARILSPENDAWLPESWTILDSSLAAAPLGKTGMVLILGRVGGPDYLPSEVDHLGHFGTVLSRMLRD